MKAKDNGLPQRCAENLLAIVRGEVPYERIKGLDASSIDRPADVAEYAIKTDAEYVLETYEPRVSLNGITVQPSENGQYRVTADIQEVN